jgi:hypothetical protein
MITGVYTYDSSTPDSDPREYVGLYEHNAPPFGIMLTCGGFVFMSDPDNVELTVTLKEDYSTLAGVSDVYEVVSGSNLPLPNGALVHSIECALADSSAGALSSDALPTGAPVLDDWEAGDWGLVISGTGRCFGLRGRITSAVLIPEPATVVLLCAGALPLVRGCRFGRVRGSGRLGQRTRAGDSSAEPVSLRSEKL